jgi:blue copper oxidase
MNKFRLFFILFFCCKCIFAQQALHIPPTLSGTQFNLNVQNGTTQFFPSVNTPTYGINGALLAPTLIFNKWDWVTLNVTNNLTGAGNSTTMHWHGLHVPAEADGGPHQLILQNATWSPTFQVLNHAGTFWYHPHGEGKTDPQVSKGLAGMIIIKDSTEAALDLPRTYGIDDIPLIVQTKAFDELGQIAISTMMDTMPMINGTVDPYIQLPAQVVRLRLLNAASDRSFLFGFSNQMHFKLMATDGGLIDVPLDLDRLRLSNGERAEILIDLASYLNDTIYLMNYGTEFPEGIIGSANVGDGGPNQIPDYDMNPLNGSDYHLLKIIVGPQTADPVTSIPSTLTTLNPWQISPSTKYRYFELDTLSEDFVFPNKAEGPFGINRKFFDMDLVNEIVHLNDVEVWTIHNKTLVAHPFHIHDVEFFVLDINGGPVPADQKGLKDVVLVMPGDSVRFITKFTDFADMHVPYMYHCHLLHHEDEGMMGSFLVIDPAMGIPGNDPKNKISVYPNPSSGKFTLQADDLTDAEYTIRNILGEVILSGSVSGQTQIDLSSSSGGMYFISVTNGEKTYVNRVIKH